jgi:hypothetical protein
MAMPWLAMTSGRLTVWAVQHRTPSALVGLDFLCTGLRFLAPAGGRASRNAT